MWILESEGDIFQNKRLWLKPGKRYLFGRTKTDTGGFVIENKSISRKHLMIDVSPVTEDEAGLAASRSRLEIEDLKSKIGTVLDGQQIKGEKRVLSSSCHEIRIGNYEKIFRIRWEPVIFCFSIPQKLLKTDDPLMRYRDRLGPLDIKCTQVYLVEKTTHVVASKRNTAKGLQALINGKYIVTEDFVEAVATAATASQTDIGGLSLLETDFDAHWPNALSYLPPQSKEPSRRPEGLFAPNPSRLNVFEGYTFVFCDQTQFENLQAPITNGAGSALLFNLQEGTTTPQELARYVKGAVGEKGVGELEDGSVGKGVSLVRFRGKKGWEDWSIELGHEVARILDLRLIEQNEFIDAILINDASGLRRPLPEADDDDSVRIPSSSAAAAQGSAAKELPPSSTPWSNKPSEPTRPSRKRRVITSRFTGFDDGFDEAALKKSDGLLGPDDTMELDSQPAETTQTRSGRKRRSPLSASSEDEARMMDELLPGAAAMKRRRIEQGLDTATPEPSIEVASKKEKAPAASLPRASKQRKEIDVASAIRSHREAEEEAAERESASVGATVDGIAVADMKNLALVETMDLPPRGERLADRDPNATTDPRWDERWNGRKNFKKFRRRGQNDGEARSMPVPRARRVIVGLEEVKKRGFGLADDDWLQSSPPRSNRKTQGKGRATSQAHDTVPGQLEAADTRVTAVALSSSPTTPRNTRQGQRVSGEGTGASQEKRKADEAFTKPPPKKRQMGFTFVDEDSDESEDELRFRFRKKT